MNFDLELEYLNKLNLTKDIKKSNKQFIQLKCPICGDSEYKARGYILKGEDGYTHYNCFNDETCSRSYYKFLEYFNESLAKDYFMKTKKESLLNYNNRNNYTKKPKSLSLNKSLFTQKDNSNNLLKVPFNQMIYSYVSEDSYKDQKYNLEELNQEAKDYLENRGFTKDDYKDFKFVSKRNDIVIPFFSDKKNNKVYAIQTRGLNKIFHNQFFRNKSPKIYNLENILKLPKKSKVYLFESVFNLLSTNFIKNGGALIGKTINNELLDVLKDYELIFVLDMDKPGLQSLVKLAYKGYSGLFSKDLLESNMDINDLLKEKSTKTEITEFIEENIYKSNRLIFELHQVGYKEIS